MEKPPNEVKDRIHAEDTDKSDKVMIFSTTIPSTSNTLKHLAVDKSFLSSYIQRKCNDKKETIINIFSEFFEPLLKYINHPELLQKGNLNLDDAEYERNVYANLYKTSGKNYVS